MNEDLVAIARIARSRGLKGELVADVLTDFPGRFDGTEEVIAAFADGSRRDLKIERFWFQKDRVILKFVGIDSVEDAESLRDAEICIPESEAVELESDEFFDWELEGCEVSTMAGETVGRVTEVMRTGGTEILVIEGTGRDHLVPFAETICVEVDVDNKKIIIDPPDGLLEF